MNLVWVSRATWGSSSATEKFIANRVSDDPEDKTEVHVHHSASVDADDDTPNRWDYDEAVTYMRRLQWVRPDLGPLPYSENLAVSEDLETVWVFQGRGILTRGAHTGGHNVPGVGWGVLGNFNRADTDAAAAAVKAIETQVFHYRQTITPLLGNTKNPNGWNAWGHRDTSSTTCPGHSLYPLLANFTLEEDDMTPKDWTAEDWALIDRHGWGALVGKGDNRETLASVLVQARNYAKADFLNGDGVSEDQLVAAIADTIEEAGIAAAVVDELAARLVN